MYWLRRRGTSGNARVPDDVRGVIAEAQATAKMVRRCEADGWTICVLPPPGDATTVINMVP